VLSNPDNLPLHVKWQLLVWCNWKSLRIYPPSYWIKEGYDFLMDCPKFLYNAAREYSANVYLFRKSVLCCSFQLHVICIAGHITTTPGFSMDESDFLLNPFLLQKTRCWYEEICKMNFINPGPSGVCVMILMLIPTYMYGTPVLCLIICTWEILF
jgi:hypothetical protein